MVSIRLERESDIDAISDVQFAAFEHDPHREPGGLPTEHRIVAALRDAGKLTLSLVAVTDGVIVGHIAFSPVLINGVFCDWYGLGPVAVIPDWQDCGVGSSLIVHGMDLIQRQGAVGVVLIGDPAFYSRFGFISDSRLVFPGAPPTLLMSLSFGAQVPTGTITYEKAFYID
jgi:putative acetyltransferase